MKSFSQDYYDEGNIDISKVIPRLPVKYREELCFKGRKVDYVDLTKFVKRGSSYTPLVCWDGEIKDTDYVMDLAPCLCVGVSEMMSLLTHDTDAVNLRYQGWLRELDSVEDWYEMLEKGGHYLDLDTSENECSCALAELLRSSVIDMRWPTIKRTYSTLMALRWLNPKSFSIALIEGTQLAFSIASIFMAPDLEMGGTPGFIPPERMAYEQSLQTHLNKFGALEYTPEGQDRVRRITDGRGVGLSFLCLWMHDVYKRFGDNSNVSPVVQWNRPKSRENIMNMLEACLGDDYVGRLIRNGRCRLSECEDKFVIWANQSNLLAADCSSSAKLNGYKVGRGMYEAHLLWKKAVGVEEVKTPGFLPPMDCTYGTRIDLIHACIDFAFSDRGMVMTKDLLNKEEQKVLDKVMQELDVDSLMESYKQTMWNAVQADVEKFRVMITDRESEIAQANERIAEYERVLSEKQHIIDQLRDERDSLVARAQSTYSEGDYFADDSEDELIESEVPREEMLEFVNQFKLVLVGGFDTMKSRMEAAGFTNFQFITSERASNTMTSGDFFCLCTRFLSHKLEYRVEAQYRNQLSQFFHFNGTNVEVLLRVCYEFMKLWFDGEGVAK